MRRLECMIGSLSFDGFTYEKCQIFSTDDTMTDHLLQHRLVREILPEPEPTPEPEQELADS